MEILILQIMMQQYYIIHIQIYQNQLFHLLIVIFQKIILLNHHYHHTRKYCYGKNNNNINNNTKDISIDTVSVRYVTYSFIRSL